MSCAASLAFVFQKCVCAYIFVCFLRIYVWTSFVTLVTVFHVVHPPVDLLSLLKWKQSPDRIVETLTRMMKLKGEEVVKFLQDVLDALFAMFSTEDGNSTQHSGLVFQVLVRPDRLMAYSTLTDTAVLVHCVMARERLTILVAL